MFDTMQIMILFFVVLIGLVTLLRGVRLNWRKAGALIDRALGRDENE